MSEMLKMQLQVTHGIFQINTDAVSHEESLYQPTESGNCLNWIAGQLGLGRRLLGKAGGVQ